MTKKIVFAVCLFSVILGGSPCRAQDASGMMDISPILDAAAKQLESSGKKSDETALEDVQTTFIKLMFLDPFFEEAKEEKQDQDDEDEESLMNVDLDAQSDIFSSTMARKLAKQDILQMKKKYLRSHQIQLPTRNNVVRDRNNL